MDLKRLSDPAVRVHLQLDSPSKPELSIQTFPYESVYTELQAICAALGPKDKVWICDKASCALTQVIPKVREMINQEGNHYLSHCKICKFAPLWRSERAVIHVVVSFEQEETEYRLQIQNKHVT